MERLPACHVILAQHYIIVTYRIRQTCESQSAPKSTLQKYRSEAEDQVKKRKEES